MKKLLLTKLFATLLGVGVVFSNSIDFAGDLSASSTAADQADPGDKVKIYPNPADAYILLKSDAETKFSRVEIHNIFGRLLLAFPAQPGAIVQRFDINELPKGVYMIRGINSKNRVIFTKTVSKR